MLSTVFLIAAELLHGLLFFEMPAGKWNKLITLSAQAIPDPSPFDANHSADTQDFHGGLLGSSFTSVGFSLSLACMRSCLKSPNCSSSLRREM